MANQRPLLGKGDIAFNEYFAGVENWVDDSPICKATMPINPGGQTVGMKLGRYLTVHAGAKRVDFGYLSFAIKSTERLRQIIEASMIGVDYDTLYFELIVFPDAADLYVSYNKIIGQRYLARIGLDNLPELILIKISLAIKEAIENRE